MILHPAIIALLLSSALTSLMMAYVGFWGFRILRRWDLTSGSELQLNLERRTYLLSTILTYLFGLQIISLFLLIYTVENLHPLFVGAMCAAGTLNANPYGYPLLVLKIANCILAGLWLVLNAVDIRGYDYPLIRKKYAFLLSLAPLFLTEGWFQVQYFRGLRADVITSCCGSLFGIGRGTFASEMAALPTVPALAGFYGILAVSMILGVISYRTGKGGMIYSFFCFTLFLSGVTAIVSSLSVYIYELPSHHCPFCVLQREYGYIGYLLYGSILGGAIPGMGAGMISPFGKIRSLARVLPPFQKRLIAISLWLFGIFGIVATYGIVRSNLRL